MTLKPWREIAVPHEDVLKGTFLQSEFAADLSKVQEGTASPEYQNARLFFQRTFITEGMRLLLNSVVKRIAGLGGDPVLQLQTAFGGGKTHTMMAVYHIATGEVPPSEMLGVHPILNDAGIIELPRARVVVLDGIRLSPNQPIQRGGELIHTIWGELAWQLGASEGYSMVREADRSGTSPGKEVLEALLRRFSPCVVLIDELVAYVRQFEEGKTLSGGTFDSNISFTQALTEAVKGVPTAILLASLPESEKEAGSQRGVKTLNTLAHYFGRVQALWKPVAAAESFEIVRRRLFTDILDRKSMEAICRSFADYYTLNGADFPQETQKSEYFDRLMSAYPIHPEVFDRLYEDWSSLDSFQRTRGVLKLMAKVIHRLWKDGSSDPLIMPGSLPLYDADTRNEAIYYLPQGWDPVVERDIDGERSETSLIESDDPRLGSLQACRRVARTIFLGSAPTTASQVVRGANLKHVLLGVAQPGQQPSTYKDALRRLKDRLHYLNTANDAGGDAGSERFWFDVRANLRREMEERKRRFQDKTDVYPRIRDLLRQRLGSGVFDAVHVFVPTSDVPDDNQLRLVVLTPDVAYNKTVSTESTKLAAEYLNKRGEQPRFKKNRLIFLVAEFNDVSRLKDHVRSVLAWESILQDIQDFRLNLDQLQARQARQSKDNAKEVLERSLLDAYRWLLVPYQEGKPGEGLSEIKWEALPINPGASNPMAEMQRVLIDSDLLITEWAPIHLKKQLQQWFWKGENKDVLAHKAWEDFCQHLYFPRLKNRDVYSQTLMKSAGSADFMGFAQGREEGKYLGFSYNRPDVFTLDQSLLLIEPQHAKLYQDELDRQRLEEELRRKQLEEKLAHNLPGGGQLPPKKEPNSSNEKVGGSGFPSSGEAKRFFGTVSLDPVKAKMEFAGIVDEVLQHFSATAGVKITVTVEINAQSETPFSDHVRRTVKENAKFLEFKTAEFE